MAHPRASIDQLHTDGTPRFDLAALPKAPPWMAEALCAQVDPDGFFPEKGGGTRAMKRVCAQCPVTEQCLRYALDRDESHGVWGGKSATERRKLVRARAAS